ncbi:protein kinase family protein [Nocardioides sp. zg-ZUI104]|uniref:protein kinase family protein n=1 Tax=Nocardioides faecalis TaxID=2803858 RepID=UPI001BCA9E68|nr:protein kinase family protein [Nocardioides faecalis]MBS4753178.1 protein kinase family protein [Nocardioides faecalis]
MPTSTRSGDVLSGRYRLIDLLSESGGGRFWRARDTVLERFVALHVIPESDPRAPALLEAARTSAAVVDPRILRVLDAKAEDGHCFVVNEWGTGISLDILVTHAGPLEAHNAAWLVADVADALAQAHDAGVTHGRLNPENVLIDGYGAVRIIGMCVDAALHGLSPGDVQGDLDDLGGLLYCALTGTWPGPSGSIVPAAPREGDCFLSPRQVRAGVPKPLDLMWRELSDPALRRPASGRRTTRRRRSDASEASGAHRIAAELLDFVGDPTHMQESLARAIPPINQIRPVWLPAMSDPLPHDASQDDIPVVPPARRGDAADTDDTAAGTPEQADVSDAGTDLPEDQPRTEVNSVAEVPTEAGMPVFQGEDVTWLRTRSTPPPPPPPFEAPPERPLFAPDPPGGRAHRRTGATDRADTAHVGGPDDEGRPPGGYWPWEAGAPLVGDPLVGEELETEEHPVVPGRSWLRLAMAVGLALLVLCAVAVAFNLGRGRTLLGTENDAEPESSPAATASPTPLRTVDVRDFDPFGEDGAENPESVPNVLDGDVSTTWNTQTYKDQFGGPRGLKDGVGLLLDLGEVREVREVDVRLAGPGESTVELYVSDEPPDGAPEGEPAATATGAGRLTLVPGASTTEGDAGDSTAPGDDGSSAEALSGRYVVLWWTALPKVPDGFRAEISEVVVRAQ